MGMYGFLLRVSTGELQQFLEVAKPAPPEAAELPSDVTDADFDRTLERTLPLVLARMPGGSSPERIAKLKANPQFRQKMVAMFYAKKGGPKPVTAFLTEHEDRAFRLEKAFHALHWLLTGQVWGGDPPLANAVLGGTEYGPDLGYGKARYLYPEEVAQVAQAMQSLDFESAMRRWDAKAMKKAKIYAVVDKEGRAECATLLPKIRDYYRAAAGEHQAMLLYIL